MAWHAPTHPGGRRRPSSSPGSLRQRVADYSVGTKRMLIVPVCGEDQSPAECAAVFNVMQVANSYGGSVVDYLHGVVGFANEWLAESSYGQFQLDATVTSPLHVKGYTYASCGDFASKTVGWTSWAPQAGALDVLAYAQAEAELGIARAGFDFAAIFIAKCTDLPFSGRGWVGIPGFAMNSPPNDMDPSFIHELGHNLGLNHGARLKAGSQGRAIWETGFIETNTPSPTGGLAEYGASFTPMGRGLTPDGHFALPAKIVLEWVADADTVQIPLGAACAPCGPYLLQPADTGVRGTGPLGLRIATPISSRYFWVEHRTKISAGSAAVVASAAYQPDSGDGGVVSKAVMADKIVDA
eukprot:scaffold19447_cov30-Tisochrysis_lutea.AAC.1